ncbi:MAG: hypothetical protein A2896_02580 [Candidatus Nealsonbacteria bacterium RIFCSPLOWO2_01_FULL_43_32]|uniref:DUF4878 domain-containing protein n=1 Tax=Candidatus Nealsonbacteria bacterium RIFCSPLOWO2_01_FULL_43_32 TaxID=1801672 RepID=A0A1G2EHB3_9BACT|nr:MAG: hypothetical protein A2896_02580 [Candidatus Nealsonbacteria bacterium RIFCSPLOWO2_01_FULL_43_32]
MAEENLDKKGVFRAMVLAILIAFLGIGLLGWQYRKIEQEKIPALEQKLEQKSAEAVLDRFMGYRVDKNEKRAEGLLTERATEEKLQSKFVLIDSFENYEIIKSEKLADGNYRFIVKVVEEDANDFVEVIILTKILGQYYIDSVELAG